mgnify:CR=1 FL=1
MPATSSTSAAITYRDNAFVWTEDTGNLVTGSFVAVAGRSHDMRVSLWKKDASTGSSPPPAVVGTSTDGTAANAAAGDNLTF